ncbi:MAG: NAD(P)-dependent oxidoreductase [Venatoribacter sp.]
MNLPRLGFIGMGLMGVPMSLRLLKAGYPLTVWNRNPAKTESVVAAGAQAAASLQELVANSDVIMLCISDTDAVRQVILAHDGVLASLQEGQIIIDFSSIDPVATRELAELTGEQGVAWLDAPVSGGVAGAEQGSLAVMIGGDATLVESVRPVLSHLSARVTHMGPVGSGQITKIGNQMLVSCNVLVMAEVMALAQKAGVDASLIPQALQGGFADSIPLQLTGPRMANQEFEPVKWRVKTLLKDLDMANALAKSMHSSVPMAGLGAELMRLHSSKGFAEQDPSTLVLQYKENQA